MRDAPDLVKAIVTAILGTALADGSIQPEEKATLRAVADQFGLEEGEIVDIMEERPRPVLPDRGSGGQLERLSLMRYAVLAAQSDGRIERTEYGFLKDLGERIGLTPEEWTELEEFSADLYTATRGGTINEENIKNILEKYVG